MFKLSFEIIDDLLLDSDGNIVPNLRYDPYKKEIVKPSGIGTYYIDENGIKHIVKLKSTWQEITCDFDDPIIKVGASWIAKSKLESYKDKKIKEFKDYAYKFITSFYPEWKQSNDIRDFQSIVTELRALYNVSVDEIYADVYTLKGPTTVEEILIKYGIRNGYILTNSLGQPLYNYYLNDGTVVQANKDLEVIDSSGNVVSKVDFNNVVNFSIAYTDTAPIEEISRAIDLTNKLKDILNRMNWLDTVRNVIDDIENEMLSILDPKVLEAYDYKSKLERFKLI